MPAFAQQLAGEADGSSLLRQIGRFRMTEPEFR
jgi:hypothetical protein